MRRPDGSRVLLAEGLSKRFGRDVWALRDISISIDSPGVIGLVGPNAAGKSTLMKTWMGFERPTKGSVAVCGDDPTRRSEQALQHLGYVPQVPALYRELSVSRHLDLAAAIRPGFDRAHAERRLDDLGVPLSARAGHLSGGQAAQVSLAIALGTRARVLLLDEPLASLDPLARREMLDVLARDTTEHGSTALLSSHVVADVERVCDRLIILGVGRILLDATITETRARHRLVLGERPADGADSRVIGSAETADRVPAWVILVTDRALSGQDHPSTQEPTLEQVVLAYLASASRRGDWQ